MAGGISCCARGISSIASGGRWRWAGSASYRHGISALHQYQQYRRAAKHRAMLGAR